MTQYCLIEDGQIIDGPRTLPMVWRTPDGRSICGLRLWGEQGELRLLKAEGWLPVDQEAPALHDTDTHMVTGNTLTVNADDITATPIIKEKPEPAPKSTVQKGLAAYMGFELTDAVLTELNKSGNELLKTIFLGD